MSAGGLGFLDRLGFLRGPSGRPVRIAHRSQERPEIICLCGSSRYVQEMAHIAWTMEKEGAIVLGLHLLPTNLSTYGDVAAHHQAEYEGVAEQMDKLHLCKIDLADRVLVVNIDGYIGDSTRREIEYATEKGKPVQYWEAEE